MHTSRRFYGWTVLVVFMFVFLATTAFPYFGAGVVNAAMAKDLGLSRTTLGLAFSLLVLCSGLPGPLVAWVMGRIGARRTATLGSGIVALGAALIAVAATSAAQFAFFFGVVVGTGVCFSCAIPAQTTVTRWFVKRRALALSILWLAMGVGGAIAAPLLGRLIAYTGNWRSGWYLMATLAASAAVVTYLGVVNDPGDIDQMPDGVAAPSIERCEAARLRRTHQTSGHWTLYAALRTLSFWVVTACAITYSLPLVVMFAHMVPYLRDMGYSPAIAAASLGLVGLTQIVGKLIVGFLGDRVEPRYLWAAALACMAGGLFVAIGAKSQAGIYAFAVLLGIGQGASLVAMPTMMGNYFGAKVFAMLSGVQTPMITVAISVGPVLVGLYYDSAHTYIPAFFTLALILVAGALMMLFVQPPRIGSPNSPMTMPYDPQVADDQ
jgi:MFS family permease